MDLDVAYFTKPPSWWTIELLSTRFIAWSDLLRGFFLMIALRETNIAPENGWLE